MCGCICFLAEAVLLLCLGSAVYGQVHCPYDGDLVATSEYSTTIFNQSLPAISFFEQMDCEWTIQSKRSEHVRLNFTSIHILIHDCITVYDGASSFSSKLASLCSNTRTPVYNSTGSYLTVTFTQGPKAGQRWFSMNYTSVETETDPPFWETTAGRVISFAIFVAIFGVFSLIFKGCKKSDSLARECCDCIGDAVHHCLRMCLSAVLLCSCLPRSDSSVRQRARAVAARTGVVGSQPASEATGSTRSSVRGRTDTEEEGGDFPWTVELSGVDPTAPPAYTSAVAYPEAPPGGPGTMSPPPTYHDSTSDAPPPPSYESLFKDSSQA